MLCLIGIAKGPGMEIVGDGPVEGLQLEKACHHPDDGAALRVGDHVENLVDLVRIVDRDGDGVGRI